MKHKPKAAPAPRAERALPAAKWVAILDAAGLAPPAVADAKTPHARAIKVGQWLSARVGREVLVTYRGRATKAVLRVVGARANEKRYYFEVVPDRPRPADEGPARHGKKGRRAEDRKPSGKRKRKAAGDDDR